MSFPLYQYDIKYVNQNCEYQLCLSLVMTVQKYKGYLLARGKFRIYEENKTNWEGTLTICIFPRKDLGHMNADVYFLCLCQLTC